MFGFIKRRRRRRLRERPFPEAWRRTLERHVPLYRRLPAADRAELHGHVQVFLAEKSFEGAGGLAVTDEMRVIIAAQACLLLLHRDTGYFPRLQAIIVYPETYVAPVREQHEWIVHEREEDRLGESWGEGVVVLSWRDVLDTAAEPDGVNVVLHEFAHQLDEEDGAADGAPVLPRGDMYASWARVLREAYDHLRRQPPGADSVLDAYGAETPAEFFAVATETFFELPHELRAEHPALYDELRKFYEQDPAAWGW